MKYLYIILLLFLPILCFCQTEISGEISGTLTLEYSPYVVVDTCFVRTDDTLIIEPGCEISFNDSAVFMCDSNATIIAIGTEEDSIFFSHSSYGYDFNLTSPSSATTFSYCKMQSLYTPFLIVNAQKVSFDHCCFDNCYGSFYWWLGADTLENYGLLNFTGDSLKISNCSFHNIQYQTILARGNVLIEKSTFDHCCAPEGACIKLYESKCLIDGCSFSNTYVSDHIFWTWIDHRGEVIYAINCSALKINNSFFYDSDSTLDRAHDQVIYAENLDSLEITNTSINYDIRIKEFLDLHDISSIIFDSNNISCKSNFFFVGYESSSPNIIDRNSKYHFTYGYYFEGWGNENFLIENCEFYITDNMYPFLTIMGFDSHKKVICKNCSFYTQDRFIEIFTTCNLFVLNSIFSSGLDDISFMSLRGHYPRIINSIITSRSPIVFTEYYDTLNVIFADPLFIDDDYSDGTVDLRLRPDSPAIDRGAGSYFDTLTHTLVLPPNYDIEGRRRPMNGHYDIGAHEFAGEYINEPPVLVCPDDIITSYNHRDSVIINCTDDITNHPDMYMSSMPDFCSSEMVMTFDHSYMILYYETTEADTGIHEICIASSDSHETSLCCFYIEVLHPEETYNMSCPDDTIYAHTGITDTMLLTIDYNYCDNHHLSLIEYPTERFWSYRTLEGYASSTAMLIFSPTEDDTGSYTFTLEYGNEYQINRCSMVVTVSDNYFSYDIKETWNFLSYPFEETTDDFLELAPYGVNPYYWHSEEQVYDPTSVIHSAKGFWLFSENAETFYIHDKTPIFEYTDTLFEGWNLLSSIADTISTELFESHPELVLPVYYYNSETSTYEESWELVPGKAYWLMAREPVVIRVRE